MPYSIVKDQGRTPKGKVKYEFYIRIMGKRHRNIVTCPKSAVDSLYRKWEKSILDGLDEKYLFFEIYEDYLKFVLASKPEQAYLKARRTYSLLRECLPENLYLHEFRRTQIEDFKLWRKKNKKQGDGQVSEASINRDIAELSIFFTWCIVRELYKNMNPCFKAKYSVTVGREVRLTPEQIGTLLEKAKERGKIYTAVLIALLTGMRKNEIYTLAWSDCDFRQDRIILRAENTKSNKRRIIPIPDFLKSHLLELRKKESSHTQIFQDWKTEYTLRSQWERLRKTLSFGILPSGDNLHSHDLRHVYAQSLRDSGVSLSDIQTFLGHADIATTHRLYAQFGDDKGAKEKVEKIGDVIPIFRQKAV